MSCDILKEDSSTNTNDAMYNNQNLKQYKKDGVYMSELMCRNIVVMKFNMDESEYDVLHPELLPWSLKDAIKKMPQKEDFSDIDKYIRTTIYYGNQNKDAIMYFITSRVLPLSRTNAKKILTSLGMTPQMDNDTKYKLAKQCRALTLQDDYWFREDNEQDITWEKVNLRNNPLNNALIPVALHGTPASLQGHIDSSPELTTQGAYAKAWIREEDGLFLYKKGNTDPTEAKLEVEVSGLLDICNVRHLHYERAERDDVVCCKCKLMSSDSISMMHAEDFITYCNRHELDVEQEVCKIDKDTFYKMWIVDYLIANSDRHGLNWGFFYNPYTTKIISCHPLYDHNNAFDKELMENPDHVYIVNGRSMRDSAKFAMRQVDFHFTREPERRDFLTTAHYHVFTQRAKELGIRVVKKANINKEEALVNEETEKE